MSYSLNASGLFSHPGRYLEEHLLSVAISTYKSVGDSLSAGSPYKPDEVECVKNVSYIIGLLHDFGKVTKYFQEYIQGKKVDETKKRHSLLSAIVTFNIVSKYLDNSDCSRTNPELSKFLKVVSYILVKDHHSDLDDFLNELSESNYDELKDLINSIDDDKLQSLLLNLNQNIISNIQHLTFNKKEILNFVDEFKKERFELKNFVRTISQNSAITFDYYFLTNILFSSLLDSDKLDATLKGHFTVNNFIICKESIESYKGLLSKTPLSYEREHAFKEAERNFVSLINQKPIPRMFFVTLPTGLGKTLIGFNLANTLRNELFKKKDRPYRIIYALPFINIIDQNSEVIENILKMQFGEVNSDLFLKHHHLSEISYKTEERKYDTDASDILIESWQSNIIITTFVQLFHTLISNKNSMLKKFTKLARSIIILDEIQAIPLKYWHIINKLLQEGLEKLDSYAIVMTATKPIIFSGGIDVLSKGDVAINDRYFLDSETYFETPNMDAFIEYFEIETDKSYMFVLNTIEQAKRFYELLITKRVQKEDVAFLSSHVVPIERLERVKGIKEGRYRFLVTTQIVEAGVDIDFDVVVRDFAPLDSIIQSAGRCNRNFKQEKGKVYVTKFKDEKRFYSSYIYDDVLLKITEQLIKGRTYGEVELYQVFDEYEKSVVDKKDMKGASDSIEEAIKKLKYEGEDGISTFGIIEKTYPVSDVFIELNDKAADVFEEFQSVFDNNDRVERFNAFKKIKKDFYSYVISVPRNIKNIPPVVSNIYYVSKDSLKEFYDEKTGFITKGVNAIW